MVLLGKHNPCPKLDQSSRWTHLLPVLTYFLFPVWQTRRPAKRRTPYMLRIAEPYRPLQVFPVYPFLQRSITQRRPVCDMRGCPTFVLWLPRDLNAHLFWKQRDLLAPYFWNNDGSPGMALQCHQQPNCTDIVKLLPMSSSVRSVFTWGFVSDRSVIS